MNPLPSEVPALPWVTTMAQGSCEPRRSSWGARKDHKGALKEFFVWQNHLVNPLSPEAVPGDDGGVNQAEAWARSVAFYRMGLPGPGTTDKICNPR